MDPGSSLTTPCDRDSLQIMNTGLSDIGIGKMCGSNRGQHVYLPIMSEQSQPMLRIITDDRSDSSNATSDYVYSIKITQIDCTSSDANIRDLRGTYSFVCVRE